MKDAIVELERTLGKAQAHIKQAKRDRRASLTVRTELAANNKRMFWQRQFNKTARTLRGC
jgi:hypothetical protein